MLYIFFSFFIFFWEKLSLLNLFGLKEEIQKKLALYAIYCLSAFFFLTSQSICLFFSWSWELELQNSNKGTNTKKPLKIPERQEIKVGIYLVSVYYVCSYINIPVCSKTELYMLSLNGKNEFLLMLSKLLAIAFLWVQWRWLIINSWLRRACK